jgi:NAD(P)-dependent dehydrogenase (short-subunit alcohol dehydrogenase family)
MDVHDNLSIQSAGERLKTNEVQLDVLINNAAVLFKADHSLIRDEFQWMEYSVITNAYGPLCTMRAFLSLMRKPARIINISSGGGSMSDAVGGWSPAYCVSRSLLNAITRQLAYELSGKRIAVKAVCPGWVKTDMGGRSAPRSVERGAETPVWLATEAPATLTGKFFRAKKEIDW